MFGNCNFFLLLFGFFISCSSAILIHDFCSIESITWFIDVCPITMNKFFVTCSAIVKPILYNIFLAITVSPWSTMHFIWWNLSHLWLMPSYNFQHAMLNSISTSSQFLSHHDQNAHQGIDLCPTTVHGYSLTNFCPNKINTLISTNHFCLAMVSVSVCLKVAVSPISVSPWSKHLFKLVNSVPPRLSPSLF